MPINNKITTRYLNKTTAISDAFTLRLDRTLDVLDGMVQQYISAQYNSRNLVDISLARQQVEQMLVDSGYYDVVGNLLDEGAQDVLQNSYDKYRAYYGEGLSVSPVSLQRIDILRTASYDNLVKLGTLTRDTLAQQIVSLQFAATTRQGAIDAVASTLNDTARRYAGTYVETATTSFYRASNEVIASDSGLRIFEYAGPNDRITRPFCARHIGERKTLEEWDSLDNGQIGPVSLYCGGYNCRHELVGIG
jgi:hypothetical protein